MFWKWALATIPIAGYRYWQLQASQYPQLSKLAIDIMTILAAVVDFERTFSELSDLFGTRRLHMKPGLLTTLHIIKNWKAMDKDSGSNFIQWTYTSAYRR
jgi:hypothetical protein